MLDFKAICSHFGFIYMNTLILKYKKKVIKFSTTLIWLNHNRPVKEKTILMVSFWNPTLPADVACLKLIIKSLDQGVKYVQS